jgi:hypothetical protein
MGFIAATIIDAREITLSQCGLIRCVPARASEGQRVPIHRQQRCLSTPAVAPKNGYLYVACTRARDPLLVTCMKPGSEFFDDLRDVMAKRRTASNEA